MIYDPPPGARVTPEEYVAAKKKPPIPELQELMGALEQAGPERARKWLKEQKPKAPTASPFSEALSSRMYQLMRQQAQFRNLR